MELPNLDLAAPCGTIGELMRACVPFETSRTCGDVLDHFVANPDCETLPIVDSERPIGLIARMAFMDRYARPYFKEIYGPKSCTNLMDHEPFIVERDEWL